MHHPAAHGKGSLSAAYLRRDQAGDDKEETDGMLPCNLPYAAGGRQARKLAQAFTAKGATKAENCAEVTANSTSRGNA